MTDWTHKWTCEVAFKRDGKSQTAKISNNATSTQRASLRMFFRFRDLVSDLAFSDGRITDFRIVSKTIEGPADEKPLALCQVCAVLQGVLKDGTIRSHNCGDVVDGEGHLPLGVATDAIPALIADRLETEANLEVLLADVKAERIPINYLFDHDYLEVTRDNFEAVRADALAALKAKSHHPSTVSRAIQGSHGTFDRALARSIANVENRLDHNRAWLAIFRARLAGSTL